MREKPSKIPVIADWARKNWQLLAAFIVGILLGAFAVQQEYEGVNFGGAEYVLIKKASIPKSLSIKGKWFYETKTSGASLIYGSLTCISILGAADISQAAASNEFSINNATRRGCLDPKSQIIKTNVGWRSINAAVLPDSRKIIVSLITADPNPRIAYIEGTIPATIKGDSPTQFDGTMYYLNTQTQKYGSTTITFYKEGTQDAKDIEHKFK
jgi:hypothetical protein